MTNLKISQIRAINASLSFGRTLQEIHPEIVDMRLGGMSITQIVEELDLVNRYNLTKVIARNSVSVSLCGHDGKLGIPAYVGLIEDPLERERICRQNRIAPMAFPLEEKIVLGRQIAEKMGYATWLTEDELVISEKDLAMALTHSESYRISEPRRGFRIGDIDNQAIADTLNSEREIRGYDQVMTSAKVRTGLYKYKKQLEKRNSS